MLIQRLKPEQKSAATMTTTQGHIVALVVYMTTACKRQSQTHRGPAERHISTDSASHTISTFFIRRSEVSTKMFAKSLLLICLSIFVCADAEDKSRLYRRPSCVGMTVTQACPLSYSPVCGNNGITYPNECSLCVDRLIKSVDILIVNDGPCP